MTYINSILPSCSPENDFFLIVLVACAAIVCVWRRITSHNPERRVEVFENLTYQMEPIYQEVKDPGDQIMSIY